MLNRLSRLKSDMIFGLNKKFQDDIRKNKVNLIVGELIRENNLYKYNCVSKVEKDLFNKNISYKYLPISGDPEFIEISKNIVFGKNNNFIGFQTLSGTGALTLSNHILNLINKKEVITSNKFWPNHANIFNITKTYNHDKNKELFEMLNNTTENVFLLQSCCHNPTGIDFSENDWRKIGFYANKNNHIIIIDNAYQGLASGDLQDDNFGIKYLSNLNVNLIVCSSFSKNLGLYNCRVGSLFTNLQVENLKEHLEKYIRTNYSNPPAFGSNIVKNVYKYHKEEWEKEINSIVLDIKCKRNMLGNALGIYLGGNGMFTELPLNKENIIKLRENEGIYMLENGRVNIAGVSSENIHYLGVCIPKYL